MELPWEVVRLWSVRRNQEGAEGEAKAVRRGHLPGLVIVHPHPEAMVVPSPTAEAEEAPVPTVVEVLTPTAVVPPSLLHFLLLTVKDQDLAAGLKVSVRNVSVVAAEEIVPLREALRAEAENAKVGEPIGINGKATTTENRSF